MCWTELLERRERQRERERESSLDLQREMEGFTISKRKSNPYVSLTNKQCPWSSSGLTSSYHKRDYNLVRLLWILSNMIILKSLLSQFWCGGKFVFRLEPAFIYMDEHDGIWRPVAHKSNPNLTNFKSEKSLFILL